MRCLQSSRGSTALEYLMVTACLILGLMIPMVWLNTEMNDTIMVISGGVTSSTSNPNDLVVP